MQYRQDNTSGFRTSRHPQAYDRARRGPMHRDRDARDTEHLYPIQVFTDLDKSVKRFSRVQAYSHAAMIIRARDNLKPSAVVYASGSYDSKDTAAIYTLEEFSQQVQRLIRR